MKLLLALVVISLSGCNGKDRAVFSGFQLGENSPASVPTLSYAGATGTSGNVGVAMSVAPTTLNNNGATITNCATTPALPAGLSINSSTCLISGTPSAVLAATSYSVLATNSAGNSSPASVTLAICPSNYANVPANATFGTSQFCVMQFEAKSVASVATSQATGFPWVSINQTSSKTACTALGAGYDLISNPEWMTIAYDIEATATNWSGGAVGTGALYRGHSDNAPASALEVTNTADPYNGTGNTSAQAMGSGKEQQRTFTLSNGEVVWDIAGNVWEWTDWTLGGALASGPTTCTAAWTEFPSVSCGALAAADYMPSNPGGIAAGSYNSTYGIGQFYGGAGGAALRGGHWGAGSYTGVFALYLYLAPSYTNTSFGFRCVYRP